MPTVMTRPEIDAAKAEAFAGRFVTALNNGALCLMASVGHRTGLFDTLAVCYQNNWHIWPGRGDSSCN